MSMSNTMATMVKILRPINNLDPSTTSTVPTIAITTRQYEMMMVHYVYDGSMMMMNDRNGLVMLMTQYVNHNISGSCRRSAIGEYFVSKI